MAEEQKITLTYTSGVDELTRDFTVYRCNPESVEFYRKNRNLLNGGISEWDVGYRRLIDVELKTLDNDKFDLFWLYGFMMGTSRRLSFDSIGYDVEPVEDAFQFEFMDELFYANALTLHFVESNISYITDTGITRTLIPLYTPVGQGITGADGQVLSIYVNLVDDSSAEFAKFNFEQIDWARTDKTYGYKHKVTIDFGPVLVPEYRAWLLEYCLWKNREIDTTQIDPVNGTVYNVAFDGDKLIWDLFENVKGGFITELSFIEKTLRTTVEEPVEPAPPSFFIADVDVTDSKPTNY